MTAVNYFRANFQQITVASYQAIMMTLFYSVRNLRKTCAKLAYLAELRFRYNYALTATSCLELTVYQNLLIEYVELFCDNQSDVLSDIELFLKVLPSQEQFFTAIETKL